MSSQRVALFVTLAVGFGLFLGAVFTPGEQLTQSAVGGSLIGISLVLLISRSLK